MLPTNKIPEEMLEKRKEVAEDRRNTCHHPGDGLNVFPELPQGVDKIKFRPLVQKVNTFEITDEVKKLI